MDAIANHIWQSTIFALAAGLLALMLRRNSASVRYWIWFAAAMKFLVPLAALSAVANRLPLPQCAAAPGMRCRCRHYRVSFIVGIPAMAGQRQPLSSPSGCRALFVVPDEVFVAMAAPGGRCPVSSLPIVDGVVYDTLRRIEREEGISQADDDRSVQSVVEPGVIGIWKPVLLWPRHLTEGLSDTQIETVLAHEVCHIVRRDNLLASVQMFVNAVFWFHPVVWWIGAPARRRARARLR